MTAKKYDYIVIYCFVFAYILYITVLAGLFVVRKLHINQFSVPTAFIVTYLKQSLIEPELDVEPITEASQKESSVSNYNEYKPTTQQKIQQKQAQTLENVHTYTG